MGVGGILKKLGERGEKQKIILNVLELIFFSFDN
jgi:hypothetical protein